MKGDVLDLEEMLEIVVQSIADALVADAEPGTRGYAGIHDWCSDKGAMFTVIVLSGEHHHIAEEFLTEKLRGFTEVFPS